MNTKEVRKRLFMTTEEFACALGVSRQTVSAWEHGRAEITCKNLGKIIELCKKNGIKLEKLEKPKEDVWMFGTLKISKKDNELKDSE